MPKVELLPVDQWTQPIEGSTEVQLCEPTGEPYSPYGVPSWLGRTGLEHLKANAADIRLTLLYNMQRTGRDLGAPGELEELAETATLLGDAIILEGDGPDESYRQRRYDALLAKGVSLFNTITCLDPETREITDAIGQAMLDRFESAGMLDRLFGAFKNKEAARRERVAQTAASVLSMNAADWMLLQNAGEILSEGQQGKQHVVVSLAPFHLDVARKAKDVLGLEVDARRINEDAWPSQETQESFVLHAIMATGRFDAAQV